MVWVKMTILLRLWHRRRHGYNNKHLVKVQTMLTVSWKRETNIDFTCCSPMFSGPIHPHRPPPPYADAVAVAVIDHALMSLDVLDKIHSPRSVSLYVSSYSADLSFSYWRDSKKKKKKEFGTKKTVNPVDTHLIRLTQTSY